MKKISEWLSGFDGHDAVDVEAARVDFEKATGETWPLYLKGRPVQKELADGKKSFKGLQTWNGSPAANIVAGYQVAQALTDQFLEGFYPKCEGRGSRFRECIEALRKAGQ